MGATNLRAAVDARRQAFRALHEGGCFVGGALALAAWGGFMRSAQSL